MSTQFTVVFDLDGTLANVDHRRPLVMGKHRDYPAFHALMHLDKPNEWCLKLIHIVYGQGFDVHLVSARPKKYDMETRKWLEKHNIPFTALHLLRANDSDTPDQEIKVNWLKNYGPENILFWVDDRLKVVKAIRECGVTVLHCAEGAY